MFELFTTYEGLNLTIISNSEWIDYYWFLLKSIPIRLGRQIPSTEFRQQSTRYKSSRWAYLDSKELISGKNFPILISDKSKSEKLGSTFFVSSILLDICSSMPPEISKRVFLTSLISNFWKLDMIFLNYIIKLIMGVINYT